MAIIIQLLVFFIAIFFYQKKKFSNFLLCVAILASNLFNIIDVTTSPIKNVDFLILLNVVILFIKKKEKCIRKEWIFNKKIILVLLLITGSFAISVLYGVENFTYSLKVIRVFLLLLSYWIVRNLPTSEIESFFKKYITASIIVGILFYLQVFGINILSGRVLETEMVRYQNYPPYINFIIPIIFFSSMQTKKKAMLLLFFFGMYILGQERGLIMVLGIGFVAYTLLKRKIKTAMQLALVGSICYVLILPMFAYRDKENSTNFVDDIKSGLTVSDMKNFESGSFAFRTAMLYERGEYLFQHPQYALFGVGTIHEESPRNRFVFNLGTMNRGYRYGRAMIESNDIAWVPILLRYGFVGVIILFGFLVYINIVTGKYVFRNQKLNIYVSSIFIYYAGVIFLSFNAGFFERLYEMAILPIFLGYIENVINSGNNEKTICLRKLG